MGYIELFDDASHAICRHSPLIFDFGGFRPVPFAVRHFSGHVGYAREEHISFGKASLRPSSRCRWLVSPRPRESKICTVSLEPDFNGSCQIHRGDAV